MKPRNLVILLGLLSLGFAGFGRMAGAQTSQKKSSYRQWGLRNYSRFVEVPGAQRLGAEACAACHSDVVKESQHAFHAQQGVECEDCHGAGSLHVDGGGDITKIVSFKKRSPEEANGVCLSCHAQDEKVRNWMAGKHSSNRVRCIDCHQTHGKALREANVDRISFDTATRGALRAASVSPETDVIVRSPSATNDACLKCHQTEYAQLSLPYHHPMREGKMSCNDCHDPHGGPGGNNLKTANVNQLCLTCHAQYRGPYAYQHPPVTENCLTCHNVHGSPNAGMLTISEPALCLQCHSGHHNGASLPLADRCTNCHPSIHGTDVPTPSGGSRFVDKGPSERDFLVSAGRLPASARAHVASVRLSMAGVSMPVLPTSAAGIANWTLGLMPTGFMPPLPGGNVPAGNAYPAATEVQTANSAYSFTPGAFRFVDGTGFLGRVGEYDSLQQTAGTDAEIAFVSPEKHLTIVSRANVLTGDDYTAASQLTAGDRLRIGFAIRSFEQQQDHYPFYAFPVLDIPPVPPSPPPPACLNHPPGVPPDCTTDNIPATTFAETRRLGNAYAQLKVPKLPVHLFVRGDWNARAGVSQFAYLDENSLLFPAFGCGTQCHFQSQFQSVNYTTRNIGGGAEVDLGQFQLTWEHTYSSFNDRLVFPTATFTGNFTPEQDAFGVSSRPGFGPPSGPTPIDVAMGNYPIDTPSPSEASTDRVGLNWTASPNLIFNGNVSYTRLRDLFTQYPQNSFDSDETLNWRPIHRLQLTAEHHQQNLINNFTPYYSLYGNVSYHDHSEGLRLDYELPKGFDIEPYYRRSGITRSNAARWPQFYSVDNTDLLSVVPSSFSNTTGLDLRYHNHLWSARAGYEWTGTHDPGYLIVPRSDNRAFSNIWLTPVKWLVFGNDVDVIVQNAFTAVPLPNTPNGTARPLASPGFNVNITGLPPTFQRRNRYYIETASATFRFVQGWNLGLGYSYQQNNMATYMAFQNDSGAGYLLEEPLVPYKQIAQAYWGDTTYTVKQRLGLNLQVTYNSARSGFRPDVNPADAAKLGNACLIATTCGTFDPSGLFPSAMNNLAFSATQISEVIVPQWIGQGKVYYLFPRKFEGGFIFYYGSYRDYFNPNLNGDLRIATIYIGRSW